MSLKLARKYIAWSFPGLKNFLLTNECSKHYEINKYRQDTNLFLEETFIVTWGGPSFYIFWVVTKNIESSTLLEVKDGKLSSKVFQCDEEAIKYLRKIELSNSEIDRNDYEPTYSYISMCYGFENQRREMGQN